ncbi:hypothetical protein ACVWWP_005027 [Bradyrhizobium sp. LM3.6]
MRSVRAPPHQERIRSAPRFRLPAAVVTRLRGPLLGTDQTIDKEDARLEKMLEGSICRGC